MTITINLHPDEESRLRERAAQNGQDLAAYVHGLITRDITAPRPADVDAALAPFRHEVEASGLTDAQLEEFFEEVREEVWREKQGVAAIRSSL
jgi:hypothetical protein